MLPPMNSHRAARTAALIAFALALPAALGAGAAEESRRYAGFGLVVHWDDLSGAPDGVAGACFQVPSGARRVEVVLDDDWSGQNVSGWWAMDSPFDPFCGAIVLDVPAGAEYLDIALNDPVLGTLRCAPDVTVATTGTITVRWS